MTNDRQKKLPGILAGCLLALFIVGVLLVLSIPIIKPILFDRELPAPDVPWISVFNYVYLYIMGIIGVLIVLELWFCVRTAKNGNPFVMSNVKGFRRISAYCFCISAVCIPMFVITRAFAFGLFVVCFPFAGMVGIVLSNVFLAAVNIKNENDLTV